jgi:multidrug transporter EmrE-like cation transporter
VFLIASTSAAGDILIAAAMRRLGAIEKLYSAKGALAVVRALAASRRLQLGIVAMACSFFSLLWSLSRSDLSFVTPAANALAYVFNAIAAGLFLGERVNIQRWTAMLFVAGGVWLLAH